VQHAARRSKETGLGMRHLQPSATPCNPLFLTRNEQVSGSSPLVGSPGSPQISGIRKPRKSCALKNVSTTLPLDYCCSPTDVGTTDDVILLKFAHVLLAFSSWTNKDYRGHIEI
jgi:hypothetical protein